MFQNIDDLEKLMHHTFYNELRVAPEELEDGVLVTEPIFTDKQTREKVVQMFFETFCVPKLMLVPQEVLSCMCYSKTCAIVVNIGSVYTSIVPIWHGMPLRHVTDVMPIGGRDISSSLT